MNKVVKKITTHVRENETAYITGGVCLIVGVIFGVRLARKKPTHTGPYELPSFEQIGQWMNEGYKNSHAAFENATDERDVMYFCGKADSYMHMRKRMGIGGGMPNDYMMKGIK